ncbi:hypothetical protein NE237_032691 [Protea cynaroides]|uniref:F-box protein n=1 Tax=Protea cynaroides TaxID=273540 RepID=A0A9Q0R3M2_9MAGN|nr:hypothetical protein NE237_032691 [Protea cynaroides]
MDTKGLLLEVLSRMSAKSILRLTFLSKTFQHGGKVELHTLSNNEDKKNFYDHGVPHSSLDFLNNTTNKILGSYNGLLVLKNTNEEDMRLFLCYPPTQKICSIPKLMTNINNDQTTFGVHMIVVKSSEDWSPDNNFYMYIKGEEWKEMVKLNTGARNIIYDMSVYCKGAIHFISDTFPYLTKASPDYKPYIVACDIDKGKSWRSCKMRIFKWGKPTSPSSCSSIICLVRLRKSVFMTWVLDDYKVGSWTLVLNTRPVVCGLGGCATHLHFTNYSNTLPLCKSRKINFGLVGVEKSLEEEEQCRNLNA